ncbi:uncharacterized protein [Littorina saxatilis]|uniref:uncharacterized protein n=1 Tax=Littorina saxatilis TaxID=31220 RepID=UPI0038B43E2C
MRPLLVCCLPLAVSNLARHSNASSTKYGIEEVHWSQHTGFVLLMAFTAVLLVLACLLILGVIVLKARGKCSRVLVVLSRGNARQRAAEDNPVIHLPAEDHPVFHLQSALQNRRGSSDNVYGHI